MITNNQFYLLGVASGLAGADIHSGQGPLVMQYSNFLTPNHLSFTWDAMLRPPIVADTNLVPAIAELSTELANLVAKLVRDKKHFCVVGGDHTSAIGTWSGVYAALQQQGDIGLIWIDAHMDSHTPTTSQSGRIHGMPLAVLLGHGDPQLTSVMKQAPKILPQNLCLVGVRSYESGEAALLKQLNVRVYFMEEVRERGIAAVMREAVAHVSKYTIGYGISLDIDSIDPLDAPGVDVPEPNGIAAAALLDSLAALAADSRLIGTEVVEFDPTRDKEAKTEKIVAEVIQVFAKARLVQSDVEMCHTGLRQDNT